MRERCLSPKEAAPRHARQTEQASAEQGQAARFRNCRVRLVNARFRVGSDIGDLEAANRMLPAGADIVQGHGVHHGSRRQPAHIDRERAPRSQCAVQIHKAEAQILATEAQRLQRSGDGVDGAPFRKARQAGEAQTIQRAADAAGKCSDDDDVAGAAAGHGNGETVSGDESAKGTNGLIRGALTADVYGIRRRLIAGKGCEIAAGVGGSQAGHQQHEGERSSDNLKGSHRHCTWPSSRLVLCTSAAKTIAGPDSAGLL